jgi:hypothetical protein
MGKRDRDGQAGLCGANGIDSPNDAPENEQRSLVWCRRSGYAACFRFGVGVNLLALNLWVLLFVDEFFVVVIARPFKGRVKINRLCEAGVGFLEIAPMHEASK